MTRRLRALTSLLAIAALGLVAGDVSAKRSRHGHHRDHHHATGEKSVERCASPAPTSAAAAASVDAMQASDAALVKHAIELVRRHEPGEAAAIKASIADPVGQTLVEWVMLRSEAGSPDFNRYARFIREHPDWPGVALMRRRAEAALWQEHADWATVRSFVGRNPTSAAGRLALARALLAEGDRSGAERELREAWRTGELSESTEARVLDVFHDLLTRADHRARMDRRLGAKDFAGAMRSARRLGSDGTAIVKACAARDGKKAGSLFEAVPAAARQDAGYTLCRAHWHLHNNRIGEAARVMLASDAEAQNQDTDEWWRERRILARRLIDAGDAETAYRIVRAAAPPANEYYRAEVHFMAGWIKLRFLDDPATALAHFAHIDEGSSNPIVLARAAYWRARAYEAAGRAQQAHASYELAARHSTAYYGQLARAKLGLNEIELRPPPYVRSATGSAAALTRAAQALYAIGEHELVISFVSDVAEHSSDLAALVALAELTARHQDARSTFIIGKAALARGFALEHYAFPNFGVPHYRPIGPDIDPSIAYSVVRTESAFDQKDVSPAKAVGLMQVTPEAGRDTAGRFGVSYDWKKLVCDPVYNTQMGAAELAALIREYRGSYVLTFAGYNAGRGRVQEWVKLHGDPRDPKVDAIDWVERIPFAETRNYVQRVIENVGVYRARFGGETQTQSADAQFGREASPQSSSLRLTRLAGREGTAEPGDAAPAGTRQTGAAEQKNASAAAQPTSEHSHSRSHAKPHREHHARHKHHRRRHG
jgi:peptidoglycan lytic transglycosylase